ncbi:cytochrome b-c1 complex subunit 9 [Onthophagus taurus]|uniref:cytochrome b-c1 complex subunit 9 n=1 Tax=Onthophagus taurus TaxID=166361 RepID=UPI000C202235|nr:cytochrome b-c1 complex subunit 9 [Onthophagus taurus]
MSFQSTLYNSIFKRTSTLVAVAVVGAFFFERTLDLGAESIFNSINKGKLWKDIKDNYSQ